MESQPKSLPSPSLYQRREKVLDETTDPEKVKLRLMQWNVLADCLCYNFPKVPKEFLHKDFRLPLMIEEFQSAGLPLYTGADTPTEGESTKRHLPDIILCQEMDMTEEVLQGLNSLDKEVYGDIHYEHELIAKTGDHTDALCVFYNTKLYKLVYSKKDHYRGPNGDNPSRRCFLMILFEHIETGKKLITCTLHLKAKMPNRKIRAMEIVEYLGKVQDLLSEIQNEGHVEAVDISKVPIIIAGDFNDDPDSPIIETMFDVDMTYGLKLNCAYKVDDKFPDFTTYKYRNEKVTKHVIDYIFYNDNLSLKTVRDFPTEDEIEVEMGHPCHRYPSDHFALGATLEY